MADKTPDPKTTRDRPAPVRAAHGSIGSTLLGILIGMALGLAIAAIVAIYVTRAPVPFVNKLGRSGERTEPPKAGAELPDPNKPLAGKARAPGAADPPSSDANSILSIFRDAPPVPPGAQTAPLPADRAAAPPPPAPAPARAPEAMRSGDSSSYPNVPMAAPPGDAAKAASSYVLQAGAFRGQDDADSMRAKLALLGFEARVLSAEVEGRQMFRVRVGPYGQLDDMNRARAKLAENGIEATVIRQR